jgi:hypothetical protein
MNYELIINKLGLNKERTNNQFEVNYKSNGSEFKLKDEFFLCV